MSVRTEGMRGEKPHNNNNKVYILIILSFLMSISSSTAATAASAPPPSLDDTIAILSEIWNTNADNPVILERIHAYVKTQLPQSIKNYQTAQSERESRKKSLELFADEFTESFLNRNKYFYSPQSELYFTYHNQVRYALINEDEIHHRILADITASDFLSAASSATAATSTSIKYKIKNRIIKSIQSSRDILSAIPESRTIQNVIGLLYPALFHTRDHAKYFLTILGDVILKKAAPLIYFVSTLAKEFIKDLAGECYALFGSTAHSFSTAFKFKYYEHQYKECRLVDIQAQSQSTAILLRLSNMPELRTSIIDLFCVAAHYSHRFGSADDFLRLHCKTPVVGTHAWFLRDRTDQQIIDEFMNYATEPASSDHEITMTNMMYLWKMYLSEFRLPSVFFAATLRSKLASIASLSATTPDIIPNRTSKYLPLVSQFRQFWSEYCFTDDREIELEIDELSTLFKEYASAGTPVGDATLLGMLRHFYPDVIIEDDKYILNVGCKLWDKPAEINDYLLQFKQQCLTNHHSFPQPLYNAYEFYCGKCYSTAKRRIISKRYFEKYFMEEYPDYIDENGMITIKWWIGDTDLND